MPLPIRFWSITKTKRPKTNDQKSLPNKTNNFIIFPIHQWKTFSLPPSPYLSLSSIEKKFSPLTLLTCFNDKHNVWIKCQFFTICMRMAAAAAAATAKRCAFSRHKMISFVALDKFFDYFDTIILCENIVHPICDIIITSMAFTSIHFHFTYRWTFIWKTLFAFSFFLTNVLVIHRRQLVKLLRFHFINDSLVNSSAANYVCSDMELNLF